MRPRRRGGAENGRGEIAEEWCEYASGLIRAWSLLPVLREKVRMRGDFECPVFSTFEITFTSVLSRSTQHFA
jgi:hypothetical protein